MRYIQGKRCCVCGLQVDDKEDVYMDGHHHKDCLDRWMASGAVSWAHMAEAIARWEQSGETKDLHKIASMLDQK